MIAPDIDAGGGLGRGLAEIRAEQSKTMGRGLAALFGLSTEKNAPEVLEHLEGNESDPHTPGRNTNHD